MQNETYISRLFAEWDLRDFASKEVNGIHLVCENADLDELRYVVEKWDMPTVVSVTSKEKAYEILVEEGQKIWIVSAREDELFESLKSNFSASVALRRLWADIYPQAVSAAGSGGEITKGFFAVVCTPRSGSTYLSELLSFNGFGVPKEHVRSPLVDMVQQGDGNKRLMKFFNTVYKRGGKNGWFGTKLISYFAKDISKEVDVAPLIEYFDKNARPKIIYLLRRDKLLQALSVQRARATNNFHIRKDDGLEEYKKTEWEYDYEEILFRYKSLWEQEKEVFHAVTRLQVEYNWQVKCVYYEDLDINPEAVMNSIKSFLGEPEVDIEIQARVRKLADSETAKRSVQFEMDYESKTRERIKRYFMLQL